jgi:hypothetical protein
MLAEMRYHFGPLWTVLTEVELNFCLVYATDLVCFGVPASYSHFLRQPTAVEDKLSIAAVWNSQKILQCIWL